MQGVNMVTQLGLPWKRTRGIQQEEGSFHQEIELKFREETNEVLHLEHSFLRCWNLDISVKKIRKYLESFEMWCWRITVLIAGKMKYYVK